jgi:pyruvate dehydrogenase (quinone)
VFTACQELVLPPKTTLGQAYAFNLFLLQAVMNGRADQPIDLAKVNLWR